MWRNFQRKWVFRIPIFSWASNLHCPIKDSLNYASYSWLTRDFEKAWKARRLGRLRMDGCETHAPVCITLRDRILRFVRRSSPRLGQKRRRNPSPLRSKTIEARTKRTHHFFLLLLLLLFYVRKKAERKTEHDAFWTRVSWPRNTASGISRAVSLWLTFPVPPKTPVCSRSELIENFIPRRDLTCEKRVKRNNAW